MKAQVYIKQYGNFFNPPFEVEVESENLKKTFTKSNKVKVLSNVILHENSPYLIKVGKRKVSVNHVNGHFVLDPKEEERFIYKSSKKMIRKIKNKIKESKESFVKVMLLERNDFNDKLSTSVGFGSQDLKPTLRLVLEYISSKYDVSVVPKSTSMVNFTAEVMVMKGEKKFDLAAN
jgi:hypothetical protein